MPTPTLSFTLEGTEENGGAVLLHDFRHFIDRFTACLRCVEERTQGTARLRHQITDLRTGSATMVVTPTSSPDAPKVGREVYTTFKQTIRSLVAGERIDPRLKTNDLRLFRELAAPVWSGEKRVRIAGVQLTTQYVANIDKLLGATARSKGTVKGRIERLNVHEPRHEFALYPPIGDDVVTCTFSEELFEKVQQAIKQSVTVSGTLTFRGDSAFPERVQVDSIEIHPPDDMLPTLASLRGLMPDATGGKTSVEFIQAVRNG